jgi:dTMP kinase
VKLGRAGSEPGCFIVVEGVDGAGTTTQTHALARELGRRGYACRVTCEPSRGPVGVFLRGVLSSPPDGASLDWTALALLFAADRMDHLEREVEPALAAGINVISDRYDLSSLIYQSATSLDKERALPWIRALNQRARRPDLTLVLSVSAEVALARRAARGAAAELFEEAALQQRLVELYARAAALLPGDRLVQIPAEGTPPEVTQSLLSEVLG